MKALATAIILSMILVLAACNSGNDAINEVPVIHARILSVQDKGCTLMIKTDKNVLAELTTYSCYNAPDLDAGELIILERWSGSYVYKSIVKNEPYDFNFHEIGYEHKLD
jgi:hypothetical protein